MKSQNEMNQNRNSRQYFYNAILLSAVTVGLRAVSVSFNAYVSQKIGAQALGLFTLVMSVYSLATTLATSGVNLAAVRMTSEKLALCCADGLSGACLRRELRREMRGCIQYSLFFGTLASVVLYILSGVIGTYILDDPRTVSSLQLLACSLLPISLTSALAGYFTGLRKVYKNAVITITEQIIQILLILAGLVILAPRGLEYACLALVGGAAVSEIVSLVLAIFLYFTDRIAGNAQSGDLHPSHRQGRRDSLSRAASIALPVAAGAYVRQGLLCAEHLAIPAGLRKSGAGTDTALASYGVLHGMVFPLLFFPSSVIGAFASLLVPELSACLATGNKNRAGEIGAKVIRVSLWFSVGVAGVFLAFANALGISIYDSREAGQYLAAFAPLIPLMYLDTAVDAVLKGMGQQVYSMKVNILDAGISLLLVLTLVPRMGIWGYVICVFVTETMNAALSISRMLAVTKIRFRIGWVALPALCTLLAGSTVRILVSFLPLAPGVPVQIAATAVLYVLFLLATGTVSKMDIGYMQKMLIRSKS